MTFDELERASARAKGSAAGSDASFVDDEERGDSRDAARDRSRALLLQAFPMFDGERTRDADAAEDKARPAPALDLASLVGQAQQAAPARPAKVATVASKRNKPNRDPGFEQVSRGGLREGHAPSKVVLPDAVDKGLDRAGKHAEDDGEYVEQGGNVVRNYDGAYEVRHGEEGDASTFEADYGDVGFTEDLVGVMHTHPTYEGGDPATFSDADMTSLLAEGQPLNLLRSGEMTFMIARTREFNRIVLTYEDAGKLSELDGKIWDCYNTVFDRTKGKHAVRLEAAVLAVCREFHLVYYKGEGRELDRVSPRPDAAQDGDR